MMLSAAQLDLLASIGLLELLGTAKFKALSAHATARRTARVREAGIRANDISLDAEAAKQLLEQALWAASNRRDKS